MRTAELLTAVGRGLLKLASPPPLALRRFADPDDSAAIKGATSSCSEPRADRCAGLARGSDWDEELFPDEQDIPSAHKSNSAKALRFDDIDSVKVTFEDPTPSPGQRPSQYLRYFGRDVAEQEAARRREAAEDEERELRDRMYVKPAKFEDAMIPILDMRRPRGFARPADQQRRRKSLSRVRESGQSLLLDSTAAGFFEPESM